MPLSHSKAFGIYAILILAGCTSKIVKTELEIIKEYQGSYEYRNQATIDLVASDFDSTLYAVIEKAKYPLKHIGADSFADLQGNIVTFSRNKKREIVSYSVDSDSFNLLGPSHEKIEFFPRKDLYATPNQYNYQIPLERVDRLEVGNLDQAFKNPTLIKEMIIATIQGEYPEVHSILILKNNKLVLEEYFYGYGYNIPHQLRSATKPFIGTLVGIAIKKGLIKNELAAIMPYFNVRYPQFDHADKRKEEITIENLLMYRHGLDCDNNNPQSEGNEMRMMESDDWIKYTLDLPMVSSPGKYSSYCTGTALVLGALVEIATKSDLEDFAKEQLFEPLGIDNYNWTFEPTRASVDHFNQLSLTPRDMLKLAKLYTNEGAHRGDSIISKDWVKKTFTAAEGDYGYLWQHKYFIIDGKRFNSYLASGNGGQKINIWPELDMITVFTGGNYNSYALYGKSTPPNEMIPTYILRAL